jgi:glycosyltransferase involved in cell wall biosynthesis
MTASAEAPSPPETPEQPCGGRWREVQAGAQEAALPIGEAVVCCSAPVGVGGLGRHLEEVLAAFARLGHPARCISGSNRVASAAPRHVLGVPYLTTVLGALTLPVSPGVRTRAFVTEFDAYASAQLPDAEHLIAFNGQALGQFGTARSRRYRSLGLVSANPHLRVLARQHALAHRAYPLEGSWAARLLERNLAEYACADRIYVASGYVRDSFLAQGFAAESIVEFPLTPDPRYAHAGTREASELFEIVYVGSLSVHKGVPLLIDAVRGLPHEDLRLRLVGGWGTRGMRRFVQSACASDARISVSPGDPLPWLRRARLCVHPAYEDGFAYAPAEALACGVPVIVSEDTGMKDLIDPPRTGLILPTGDLGALIEAIDASYRGEILSG